MTNIRKGGWRRSTTAVRSYWVGSPSSTNWQSRGLLISSAIRLIVRRMWEIYMRTQGFLGYPEFLPNITATSSLLLPLPGHREKGRRKGLAGRFTTLAAALGINLWVVLKQEKLRGQVVMTDSARQRLSESNKSDIIATSFAFIW